VPLPDLVWDKGIAALCDWRIPDEFPNGCDYSPNPVLAYHGLSLDTHDLIENPESYRIRDGDLVWVRISWLGAFVRQVLPLITSRFVLATADSDNLVPWHLGPAARTILKDTNVIAWFARNCHGIIDRLRPLPIGIDFHTISDHAHWGEQVSSPADQERELNSIAASIPPVERRRRQVYLDFQVHSTRYGGREVIAEQVRTNPCAFFQPTPLSRSELWRNRGEYAFVVSPHGHGLDCHRTWEALALGHIVLVPASPLDRIYAGLPVVSVSDWNEITPAKLEMWLEVYAPLTRQNPRWTSRWWVDEMRVAACRALSA
jgi:hypothetical protein